MLTTKIASPNHVRQGLVGERIKHLADGAVVATGQVTRRFAGMGQAFAQDADGVLIVDQHALHERMMFETLRGRILDQGSPRQLIGRHVEPEVVEVRAEVGSRLPALEGLTGCRVEPVGSSLYCYTADAGPLLERLQTVPGLTYLHRRGGLEDVFLKLTGRELRD